MLPVQRLTGPIERPLRNEGQVTLTRENIFAGSLAAYSTIMDERRIPGNLRASRVDVGPGTWLRVLTKFVGQSVETGQMPGEVTTEGGPDLVARINSTRRGIGAFRLPSPKPVWAPAVHKAATNALVSALAPEHSKLVPKCEVFKLKRSSSMEGAANAEDEDLCQGLHVGRSHPK